MESEAAPSPSEQLTDLKRAEVLAHTRYPKLGAWYPPLFGAAAAAWVAAYPLPIWGSLIVWVVIGTVAGTLVQKYIAKRGTAPDPKQAPAPIKREMKIFLAVYSMVIGAIVFSYLAVSWWSASALAFVAFTIGLTIYERRFATAAHQAEVEAGILS